MGEIELVDSIETPCIYVIFNFDGGKVYIGQTKNLKKRYKGHLRLLKKGEHANKAMQKDYDSGFNFTAYPFLYGEKLDEEKTLRQQELETMKEFITKTGFKLYNTESKEQIERLLNFYDKKMYYEMERKRDVFYNRYMRCSFNMFLSYKYKDWYLQYMRNEIIKEKRGKEEISVSFAVDSEIKKAIEESGMTCSEYIKRLVIEDYNRKHSDYCSII